MSGRRLRAPVLYLATELPALLDPDGMLPAPMSPAAFAGRVKQELAQWKEVATSRRIVAE